MQHGRRRPAGFIGRCVASLKAGLELSLVRGLDLDDPRTTALRRQIIREKPGLMRIYRQWYARLLGSLPAGPGLVVELGSGAGFLESVAPDVIKSDVLACPGIDAVFDAQALPFRDGVLRGILMTNVLHHIPEPAEFFLEATRCVRGGGVIAMIEPWNNRWSRFIYTQLHHEPFDADAIEWTIPSAGPLSGANGALPWILFARDRSRFEQRFPCWRIDRIEPLMPLRYLLSGGVSLRNLMPLGTDRVVAAFERLCPRAGMFAWIVLRKES